MQDETLKPTPFGSTIILSVLFFMMMLSVQPVAANPFNSGVTRPVYQPENANGIYNANSLSLTNFSTEKPPYKKIKFVGQWLVGGVAGVVSAYVGGAVTVAFLVNDTDGWGAFGKVAFGVITGFTIGRMVVLHAFGNYKGYQGNYWYSLLAYVGVAYPILFSQSEINSSKLVIADLAGTIVASWVHYSTLKPRESKMSAIQIAPTILQSEDRSFHGGLKLSLRF